MQRAAAVFVAFVALVPRAHGAPPRPSERQRQAAKALHDQALDDYEHGRSAAAADGFSKAFDLVGDPVLLFDIAQCHRRLGDVDKAIVYYQRYLDAAPNAANRADVEARVRALQAARPQPKPLVAQTPVPPMAVVAEAPAAPALPRIRLLAEAGVSHLGLTPAEPSSRAWEAAKPALLRVGAAWLLHRSMAEFGLGGGVTLSPVAYWDQRAGERQKTSLTTELLLQASAARAVATRVRVGVEGGVGALVWSGLADGNPMTADGAAPAGLPVLPSARIGLLLDVPLGAALRARIEPGYTVALPGPAGLGALSRVHRFELLAGLAADL